MKLKLRIIAEEFFQVSLITYLILLLTETIKEGFVSYFFDINILLGVVIVSGLFMVLTETEHKIRPIELKKKIVGRDWEFFIIISIFGSFLLYLKIQEIGPLSLLITLLSALLIFVLSYLIMSGDETL